MKLKPKHNKAIVKFMTTKVVFGYSLGQLGWAIMAGIIASQLTSVWVGSGKAGLATSHTGYIGVGIFAAIMAITKLVDAFAAPIIGQKSDMSTNKRGKRLPFMFLAILPLFIVTIAIFFGIDVKNGSIGEQVGVTILIVTLLSIFYIAVNMYMIPYTSLVNDLSQTSKERVLLSTAIAITYIIGSIIAAGTPMLWKVVYNVMHVSLKAATIIAVSIISFIGLLAMSTPLFVIKEKKWIKYKPNEEKEKDSFFKSFKTIITQGQFKWVLLADFFLWIGLIGFSTGMNYIVTGIMGLEIGSSIFFAGGLAVLSIILYPIVGMLMNKIGVRKLTVQIGFIIYAIAFIFAGTMLIGHNGGGAISYLMGFGFIALVSIPTAIMGVVKNVIISDIIATNAVLNNEDKAATYWAVRNFTSKIAMAIGMGVTIGMLAIGKEQLQDAWGVRIGLFFGAISAIFGLVAISFYKEAKFRFNRDFHKYISFEKKAADSLELAKKEADEVKKAELTEKAKQYQVLSEKHFKISKLKIDNVSTTMINKNKIKSKALKLKLKTSKNIKTKDALELKILILKNSTKGYNNIRVSVSLNILK